MKGSSEESVMARDGMGRWRNSNPENQNVRQRRRTAIALRMMRVTDGAAELSNLREKGDESLEERKSGIAECKREE